MAATRWPSPSVGLERLAAADRGCSVEEELLHQPCGGHPFIVGFDGLVLDFGSR